MDRPLGRGASLFTEEGSLSQRFGDLDLVTIHAHGLGTGRCGRLVSRPDYFLNSGLLFCRNAVIPSLAASVQAISPDPW